MANRYHVIHVAHADGTVEHVPLTKENWQLYVSDSRRMPMWTHDPDDCHNPLERNLRARGWLSEVRNPRVVEDEPTTDPVNPIAWPPEDELTPSQLQEMTSMATMDALSILIAPVRDVPRKLVVDRRGQGLLF